MPRSRRIERPFPHNFFNHAPIFAKLNKIKPDRGHIAFFPSNSPEFFVCRDFHNQLFRHTRLTQAVSNSAQLTT